MLSCFGQWDKTGCTKWCDRLDECRLYENALSIIADQDVKIVDLSSDLNECRNDRQRDFINLSGDLNDKR